MALVTGVSLANAPGFRFDGRHSREFGVYLLRSPIPGLPSTADRYQEVPGRHGVWDFGFRFEGRRIELECFVAAQSEADLRAKVRALAAWLDPSKGERELVLDTEPDKTYMARVSGALDLEMVAKHGRFTIPFFASDPFAYGLEHVLEISGETVVVAEGTAEAWPVITATVQAPTTYLLVSTPEKYVLLGRPEGVEEAPVPREELVFHDPMSSLTGWAPANNAEILNGAVSGTMTTDGSAFKAQDYGSGSGWHGPALKKGLPEPLQDFRMDVLVIQDPRSGQTGRAEVYLLDPSGVIVAMISVRDRWDKAVSVEARALVGNTTTRKDIWVGQADNSKHWVPFQGVMRLQRVGKEWFAYWALLDSKGRHHTRAPRRLIDASGAFQLPVAQVVVWLSTYGSAQATTQSITDIKVWRINPVGTSQVPYIAEAGDVLEIDCGRHLVLKNGEPRLDLLDPGSVFFSLRAGQPVTIGVEPADSVSAQLSYRERWL